MYQCIYPGNVTGQQCDKPAFWDLAFQEDGILGLLEAEGCSSSCCSCSCSGTRPLPVSRVAGRRPLCSSQVTVRYRVIILTSLPPSQVRRWRSLGGEEAPAYTTNTTNTTKSRETPQRHQLSPKAVERCDLSDDWWLCDYTCIIRCPIKGLKSAAPLAIAFLNPYNCHASTSVNSTTPRLTITSMSPSVAGW